VAAERAKANSESAGPAGASLTFRHREKFATVRPWLLVSARQSASPFESRPYFCVAINLRLPAIAPASGIILSTSPDFDQRHFKAFGMKAELSERTAYRIAANVWHRAAL
jgi:hypothetical protein